MVNYIVRGSFGGILCLQGVPGLDEAALARRIALRTGVPAPELRVVLGRNADVGAVEEPRVVNVQLRLLGGKGGFGSLLRGQKSKVKTTDFSACRDLHGRRLRHLEQDQKLREWFAQADQRKDTKAKAKAESRAQQREQAAAAASVDSTYARDLREATDTIQDAMAAASRSGKTAASVAAASAAKPGAASSKKRARPAPSKFALDDYGLDELEDDSSSSSSSTPNGLGELPSKKKPKRKTAK